MARLVQGSANHAIVLLSGGIDSSACIAFCLSQGLNVSGLFVDYGQSPAEREYGAALAICHHYSVPLGKIKCSGLGRYKEGEVTGRNAFLLTTALMYSGCDSGIIALGIHSGTRYADCSDAFIAQMQSLFDLYTDGRVIISAPFLDWNKQDIWRFCRKNSVPLSLTFSCELGPTKPCGKCLSCRDREVLIAS